MNNNVVNEIKEKLSIEEVVGSYIKLEKSGINLKACCPFHNEKTPSFFVSPDRGSFYCFGCSKGGDMFTFVEEIEGVDFKEALKVLAEKAGVDLNKFQISNYKSQKKDDFLYEILEKATLYFERELQKNDNAKKYLQKRGIEEQTVCKFRIGYAKDEWQSLYDYLKSQNYSDEQIIATGLMVQKENGRIYDRFRGRIIFPIFDEKSRVIAYSARILTEDKEQPKYINSPETSLFLKSKTLYGFNFAKQTIRKHDFAILVEGQLDVIMTHQIGYLNSVASSGTSFTEEQLKIIKRHTNNLLISFDGDGAGIKSSKKVWEMALSNEMDVKVIPLKEGKDPADIILENLDDWKNLVKNSKHIIEHLSYSIKNNFHDIRKQQKAVQTEIYPYIRSVKSYTDKSYFVEKISEFFGIDKDAIWVDINEKIETKNNEPVINAKESKIKERIDPREILFGILRYKNILNKEEFKNKILEEMPEDFFVKMEKQEDKIAFKIDLLLEEYGDLKRLSDDMYSRLKIMNLSNKKENIKKELLNFNGTFEQEKFLMLELENLSREIEGVKKKGCHYIQNMI